MPVAGSRKFVEQRMIVVHKRERFPLQSASGGCRLVRRPSPGGGAMGEGRRQRPLRTISVLPENLIPAAADKWQQSPLL